MTAAAPVRRGGTRAPLSAAQRGLWFLHAAEPDSPSYNVPLLVPFDGPVDLPALRTALDALVARHEILRTRYAVVDEEPVQQIEPAGPVELEVVDLDGAPDAARLAARQAEAVAQQPFDLLDRPPLRCALWRGVPTGDLLLLCVHHIAVDGWSLPVLLDDLWRAYRSALAGERPELPPVALQYADFAAWEQEQHRTAAWERLVADRVGQLRGAPTRLRLGPPGEPAASGSGRFAFRLPDASARLLAERARQLRVTPFLLLLAAFQEAVRRWSAEQDFLLGTTMVNRPVAGLERTVGYFVNTVPLRCAVRPQSSFRELCADTRAEFRRAMRHQAIPLELLAAALRERRTDGRPLVQVSFGMLHTTPRVDGRQVPASELVLPAENAKFDLSVLVETGDDGFTVNVEYDAARYPQRTAHGVLDTFRALLDAASAEVDAPLCRLPAGPAVSLLAGPDTDLLADHRARTAAHPPQPARQSAPQPAARPAPATPQPSQSSPPMKGRS